MEREKCEVRQSVLSEAIQILTTNRKICTISSPEYIKNLKNYLINNSQYKEDKRYAKMLSKGL